MARLTKEGKNFLIEGRSITLFGLTGFPMGTEWAIDYHQTSPSPARDRVIAVIEEDEAHGNLGRIDRIIVSSRVAVRLFLDGTIKPTDFDGAVEAEKDSDLFKGGSLHPVIHLKGVRFGTYEFPVSIFSETNAGPTMIATVDAKGDVI